MLGRSYIEGHGPITAKKESFSNVRQQRKVHPGIDIDSATHVIEAGE